MTMSWEALDALLAQALSLDAQARSAWLRQQPPDVQTKLREMLALADDDDFLEDTPALDVDVTQRVLTEDTDDEALPTVGPYTLLRRLGHGGMGSVWLAQRTDKKPDRKVALKLPRFAITDPYIEAHFARERDMLAALVHPGIARLYESGVAESGQPYLAMEYVEGQTVDDYCTSRTLDVESRLWLFVDVAKAVAHAHNKLIVHRDIKPANVLVHASGEPKLLDFGIARVVRDNNDNSTLTREWGSHAVTPDYASPEQLAGHPVTVASDVYALGLLLYRILTGHKAYTLKGVGIGNLGSALDDMSIPPPSQVVRQASDKRIMQGDLDTIVLKALKHDPDERYASVQAMIDDLRRYLKGYPIKARPDTRLYRLNKFVSRNRMGVLASIAFAAVVLAGLIGTVWQARQANAERHRIQTIQRFLDDMIRTTNPVANGMVNPGVDTLITRGLKQLDQESELDTISQLKLKVLLTDSFLRIRQTDDSTALAKKVWQQAVEQVGADHPLALEAEAVFYSGHYLPAELMTEREAVLSLPERLRAANEVNDEYMLLALRARSHVLEQEWAFAEAEKTMTQLLAISERHLGKNHPRTIHAMVLLASTQRFKMDFKAALETASRADQRAKAIHDGDVSKPLEIEVDQVLGEALAVNGRVAEAIPLMRFAATASEEVYGKYSPITMDNLADLARVEDRAGELGLAAEHYHEAVLRLREAGSKEAQASTVSNLVRTHVANRHRVHAMRHIDEWREALKHVSQVPHHVIERSADLAEALAHIYADDLDAAQRVLDGLDEAVPVKRPGTMLDPAYPRATLLRKQGKPKEALAELDAALTGMRGLVKGGRNEMHIHTEIGLNYLDLNQPEKARVHLQQALDFYDHYHARITPRWADALLGMHRLACMDGDTAVVAAHAKQLQNYWQGYLNDLTPEEAADGMADRVKKTLVQVQGCDVQVAR